MSTDGHQGGRWLHYRAIYLDADGVPKATRGPVSGVALVGVTHGGEARLELPEGVALAPVTYARLAEFADELANESPEAIRPSLADIAASLRLGGMPCPRCGVVTASHYGTGWEDRTESAYECASCGNCWTVVRPRAAERK